MTAVLYVVSTPIGNLEDITLRAIRTLKEADLIAAEDTRHSLKLLSHFGISKPMISYWSGREKARAEEVMSALREGRSVALISDAGTPGINDPGAVLITEAIKAGIEVVAIPGPSAFLAALSISGLDTGEFTYIGFLPAKPGQRKKALERLAREPRTMVFYEAPHRIIDTLIDMEEAFGKTRQASLAREITKLHEEVLRGDIANILDQLENKTIAGEYVVTIAGAVHQPGGMEEALLEIDELIKTGMGRKEAVKKVAADYGLGKKELYDKSLHGASEPGD